MFCVRLWLFRACSPHWLSLRSPPISPGVVQPRPGAGWEAGRRGRRARAGLSGSMSMCLSFTPPLSAAATAAGATAAAGIAAACSLARRRYLLGQVSSNPGGTPEAGRAAVSATAAPPGASIRAGAGGEEACACWGGFLPPGGKACPPPHCRRVYRVSATRTEDSQLAALSRPGDPGTGSRRGLATRWEAAGAYGLVRGTARCGSPEAGAGALG